MRGEIIDPGPFDSIVFPNHHSGVVGIDVDNSRQSLLRESLKLTNLPELIQNTSGNIPNGIVSKDKERLLSKLNNYIRNDKTLVS
ncbi:unnamed protein product [Trichobilharzia regenti]|nr:unnamed protein product [Trichobilharzia regenti]